MSKRFLVAIELAPPAAEDVLGKATALVAPSDTVDVLYVVDPTTVIYAADPTLTGKMYTEMYERAMANARRRLGEICEPFSVSSERRHVRYGRVAEEVHDFIREHDFDALMIGTHGRSGWRRILGSKAASILHGVPVDTWGFRVRSDEVMDTLGTAVKPR